MFKLRPYKRQDFESLYKLDQRCFPEGIAYTRAELASFTARAGSITVVAETVVPEGVAAKPELAGFIITEMAPQGYGHIVTLDVAERHRRQHLGTTLLRRAEEDTSKRGGFMTALEVAVDNLAAIDFYKKLGYHTVKTLQGYYNGKLDGLLLTRRM